MNKRLPWLVGAALLLVVAGVVLGMGEDAGKSARRRARLERVQFPRYARRAEYERMERRRTLPALVPSALPAQPSEPAPAQPAPAQLAPARARDPLLVAMSAKKDVELVFEAGAFRHLPLGELLVSCLTAGDENEIVKLREKTGLDLDSFDRIAVTQSKDEIPTVTASAQFDRARIASLFSESAEPAAYGEKGAVYVHKGRTDEVFGTWSDSLIFAGGSRSEIEAAIDRVEGRKTPVDPAITPEDSYGEVYGRIGVSFFERILPPELASAAQAAKFVDIHVDATEDVLIVANAFGPYPDKMNELARTVGGALSAARLGARAQGNDNLVELLDLARVSPEGRTFAVEAALPLAVIKRYLGDCAKR